MGFGEAAYVRGVGDRNPETAGLLEGCLEGLLSLPGVTLHGDAPEAGPGLTRG